MGRINKYGGNGIRSWFPPQVRDRRARVKYVNHCLLSLRRSSRSISSCFRAAKVSLEVATNEYFPLISLTRLAVGRGEEVWFRPKRDWSSRCSAGVRLLISARYFFD